MFSFAKSVLGNVFGKRVLEEEEEEQQPIKRMKSEEEEESQLIEQTQNVKIDFQQYTTQKETKEVDEVEAGIRVYKAQIKKIKKSKKQQQHITKNTSIEDLIKKIEPLRDDEYSKQLVTKSSNIISQLLALKERLRNYNWKDDDNQEQISWVYENTSIPFEYTKPIPSPTLNGYSLRCEFTIAKDILGQPTVGLPISSEVVIEPSLCLHIPDDAKNIAKEFTDYIRGSKLQVYSRLNKSGYWKQLLVVKSQTTNDTVVLIQLCSGLDDTEVKKEKEKLLHYFSNNTPRQQRVLIEFWNKNGNRNIQILTGGDGIVHENILGYTFQISPETFFYENVLAAKKLYEKCAEWCIDTHHKITTVLDLCCGIGVVGVLVSKSVDRVIAIDNQPEAIYDAKANSKRNSIENITYYTDAVEDRLDLISNDYGQECVAVLDPPRNCVQAKVLRAIRSNNCITRIIFICSDPKQFQDGFYRPSTDKVNGLPFKPKRAVVIDTAPHTEKQQLLIEFERISFVHNNTNNINNK